MKIGITGGAGFIGGHVAEVARMWGHEVVIFDHVGRCGPQAGGQVLLGDVRDRTAMMELAAHVDGIIHLAACLGTQETITNPYPAAETNIIGGLNFLEAITQYGIAGVNIGVGNWWMNNSYSITKNTIERFVQMYAKERGTKVNTVRLVNAYGPRQSVAPPYGPAKVRKIMPSFICRALTGADIEVYGDGQQVSDMVHVRDGAKALVLALEHAFEGQVFRAADGSYEAIEVGPMRSATVLQVAGEVQRAVEARGGPRVNVRYLPMRPGEQPGVRVVANTSTLWHIEMDPTEMISLETGVMETVKWYAENWLPAFGAGQSEVEEALVDLGADDPGGQIVNPVSPGLVHADTAECRNHQDV